MKELGKHLRLIRLSKGLTLEEMSARSRIDIGTLKEIEADNFYRIGTEFIVNSYLQAYREALEQLSSPVDDIVRPETESSEPNDFNLKLQQTQSRLARWRAFAITLIIAIALLILSEALWFLNQHPLTPAKQETKKHSEVSKDNEKPSIPEEKASSSQKFK